jgi:hypothetical protein
LVQRYDSILIEQSSNDDTLSCVAQLKMENAMLKRQVEILNLEKFALGEEYDMLSYSHNKLVDDHIMLNVAHEVIIANLNSCEPHSRTCAHLNCISPCANPCCSKESQCLNKHQDAGSQKKLCGNKKQRQLRRRRIAQLSQDIHGRMVKKLEKGKTAASVELHKKIVPKDEEINMSLEKGKDSFNHVFCTDLFSMSSKSKKRRGKRRCFKCKKSGHLIASCPYKDKDEGTRSCFGCNNKDHVINSCPLLMNQARALSKMTPTKENDKQQASCQVERRFCYKCGKQGHLSKVCNKGKAPKQVKLSQSHLLRRPKSYTGARSTTSSPRTSTKTIWVPKALLVDRYGPIPRWVPNCAN